MAKAPIVAILISKNSEKTSPLLILSKASLITGNPTGAYAIIYQTVLPNLETIQVSRHCLSK
jgi:hypothetical protein